MNIRFFRLIPIGVLLTSLVVMKIPLFTIVILTIGLILSLIVIIKPVFLVYFWTVAAPISISIKGLEIMPGMEQTLYGALNVVILPGLLLVIFIHFEKMKKGLLFLSPFLILIAVIVLPAIFAGGFVIEHLRCALGLLIFYLMGVLAYSFIENKKKLLRLILLANLVLLITSIFAILDILFFKEFVRIYYTTARSASFIHINPNELSLFCLIILGISYATYKSMLNPVKKKLWFLLLLLSLITIISTFSVAGWLSAITFTIFLLLFRFRQIKLRSTIYGFIIVTMCVLAIYVTKIYELPQFYHIRTGGTWAVRLGIWNGAVKLFLQKPFLGYSITSAAYLEQFSHTDSTHNTLLAFLVGFGLIGTMAIIWIFLRIAKNLYALTFCADKLLNNYGLSLLAVMSGIFVFGSVHSVGFAPHHFLIFWLVSLGVIGMSKRINKKVFPG